MLNQKKLSELINKHNGLWDGTSPLKSGNYIFVENNVKIHFLILIQSNSKMIVSHTGGAGGPDRSKGPFYSRWKYSTVTDSTLLCIDDPMVWEHHVHHGWFFGTKETSYAQISAKLINKIASSLNKKTMEITLYSSSSGGTAAIVCSQFIDHTHNTTCFCINPQIFLESDGIYEKIINYSKASCSEINIFNRNDLAKIILTNNRTRFILAFNYCSEWDYKKNYIALCEKNNITASSVPGIYSTDNVTFILYNAKSDEPHNAQDWLEFFPLLEQYVESFNNANKKNIKGLETSILTLWQEHYESINKNKRELQEISNLFLRAETLCCTVNEFQQPYYNESTNSKSNTINNSTELCVALLTNIKDCDTYESIVLKDLIIQVLVSKKSFSDCMNLCCQKDVKISNYIKFIDDLFSKNDFNNTQWARKYCIYFSGRPGGFFEYRLAKSYLSNEIDRDYDKAEKYLLAAFELGHMWSAIEYSSIPEIPYSPKKLQTAQELLRKSFGNTKGNSELLFARNCIRTGNDEYDLEEIIKSAFNQGAKNSQLLLADYYIGRNDPEGWKKATEIYSNHINEPGIRAKLTTLLLRGKGCEKDFTRATSMMNIIRAEVKDNYCLTINKDIFNRNQICAVLEEFDSKLFLISIQLNMRISLWILKSKSNLPYINEKSYDDLLDLSDYNVITNKSCLQYCNKYFKLFIFDEECEDYNPLIVKNDERNINNSSTNIINDLNMQNKYLDSNIAESTHLDYAKIHSYLVRGNKIYSWLKQIGGVKIVPLWRTIGDQHKIASLIWKHLKNTSVVVLRRNATIASLFPEIENTIVLNDDDFSALLWFIKTTVAYDDNDIILSGKWSIFFSNNMNIPALTERNHYTDSDMFCETLSLPRNSKFASNYNRPSIICNIEKNRAFSNAILLNPFANTLFTKSCDRNNYRIRSFSLFSKLSEVLISKGYKVYTNIGYKGQEPLPGSEPLNLSLLELQGVAPFLKCTISVMSGLIESIIFSKGNAICIHSDNARLKSFNLSSQFENCTEYTIDDDQLLEKIIENVDNIKINVDYVEKEAEQKIHASGNSALSHYICSFKQGKEYEYNFANELELGQFLYTISQFTDHKSNAIALAKKYYRKGMWSISKFISLCYNEGIGCPINTNAAKIWLEQSEKDLNNRFPRRITILTSIFLT